MVYPIASPTLREDGFCPWTNLDGSIEAALDMRDNCDL